MGDSLEQIAEVISHLHDGSIGAFTFDGSTLLLTVCIQYIAERIDPAYRTLTVRLQGARELAFAPWWDDANQETTLTDLRQIFRGARPPQILSAAVEDGRLTILLNCPEPHLGYCGGGLTMLADGIEILDPGGKPITPDELAALSDGYWEEFGRRNSGAGTTVLN